MEQTDLKNNVLSDNEFQDLWLNKLTEAQRITRAKKAFVIIRRLGEEHIALFKKHEKSNSDKDINFLYFTNSLNGLWENVDFVLALGKRKNRKYAFYPTRNVLETVFRLEHFTRQKKEGQNNIAIREVLRIAKRLFDQEVAEGGNGEEFKKTYDWFANGHTFPKIEVAKSNDDPFPPMKNLITASKMEGGDKWYIHYQWLAELTHGKLMLSIIANQDERAEYRRCLMYLTPLCIEALKIADFHLGNVTKDKVTRAIKEAEAIVKKTL